MGGTSSRRRAAALGVGAVLLVTVTGTVAAVSAANHSATSAVGVRASSTHDGHHRPRPTPKHTRKPTPTPTTSTTTTPTPTTSTTTTPSPTSTTPSSTTTPPSTRPTPTGVVYSDHVAQWNVLCSADHYSADDPIVYPKQPGASHMHTFYGNTSTDAASTLSSLSATSPSSCGRGMGSSDISAYWVPSLMIKNADGTSTVVKSEQTNVVYYRRAGGGRGPGVLPFPKGLRMIAGNAKATSDQSLSIVHWDCGGGGLESPHMYQCPGTASAPIHASLIFPSCWDGVHLDSADHKSHMAYAAADGTCPSDHPVSLPEVTFEVDFPGIAGGPNYYLASGGIYSWHGDFVADWDNQVQNALVAACLNSPHECGDMNRDGTTLFRPSYDPEPITINMNNYSTSSPWDGQPLQNPMDGAASSTAAPMPMSGMHD